MFPELKIQFFRATLLMLLASVLCRAQYSGTWHTQAFPLHEVRSVKATSPTVAWAGGVTVYRTTDAGANWTDVGDTAMHGKVFEIEGLNADTAFAATWVVNVTTYIYRTSNGGSSWQQVFSQNDGFIDGIHMFDESVGLAIGDPVGGKWTVAKTTDGGLSWARTANEPTQIDGEYGVEREIAYAGDSFLWFTSDAAGRIYKTSDRGETWGSITSPWSNPSCLSLSDSNRAFISHIGGSEGALTTDGGLTWTNISLPIDTYVLFDHHHKDLWIGGGTIIEHSTDLGVSWTIEDTTRYYVSDFSFAENGPYLEGWAVGLIIGDTGGISGYSGVVTGASESKSVLPASFSLDQNYPNPFNPSTTIHFEIPEAARVVLKVFNLLGQKMATLVDDRRPAGKYDVHVDGSAWPTGVYYYRLTAGGFMQIKKMLVVQ